MTIVLAPVVIDGTVIVPAKLPPLFTVRVLVAVVPPTVTPEMVSESAQPDPVTVITVPTEPEVGLKVAVAFVTVNALLNVWAPLTVPVMTIVLAPVLIEGTVIVPVKLPLLFTVRLLVAVVPPTVTPEIVSEATQPDPVIVIIVPDGPELGLKVAVAVVTVKAPVNVWAPLLVPVITMGWAPVLTEGTVIVPDKLPLLFTVRLLVAVVPPTVTLEMVSDATQPDPETVTILPTGPEVGLKVAVAIVTVKAPVNVWAPLFVPVITMGWAPALTEGTVIVPDKLPLLFTVRVLVAVVPPTVTLEIVSDATQPDPETVTILPTGPEVGLKVAVAVVTVKALLNVWAPPTVPVMTIVLAPVVIDGTVIVPDKLPLPFTVRVLVAVVPPTVTPEMVSESAQPDPETVTILPTGPEVGLKVAVAVVTVKALLNVLAPLTVPVMTIVLAPALIDGTMIVPDKMPLLFTVKLLVAVVPPTVTLEMVSEETQLDPETVTILPAGPEVGLKVAVAVVTVKALLNVWAPLTVPVMTMG
jgi:hypothetical protein